MIHLILAVDLDVNDPRLMRLVDWCATPLTRSTDPIDLFYHFFNRKNNLKFVGKSLRTKILQKALLFYFIYVLIPAILQKHPFTFPKLYFRH
jgi:hypothetical protein